MKKTSILAKSLMGAAVIAMSLGTVSCKDDKQEDPKEVAEEQNEETFENNDNKEDDSEYLVFAATMDMKEIELGKLAQQKATHADVKAFGKMMEEMHSKSLEDLKATAQAKNITLPSSLPEKGQEAYKELNDKSGADFDKKYADMMVEGHEKAIDEMEDASENASDSDIRMWAANMLPNLRSHLDQAKALKEKTEAMK